MSLEPFFISYSSRDRDVADAVLSELEAGGHSVWIAPRNVPPGMSYPEAIVSAIRECGSGILVLTHQSNSSPHVLREVERISSDGKPFFVLRTEDVTLSDGLAYFASVLQWIEAPRQLLLHNTARVLEPIFSADYLTTPTSPVISRDMDRATPKPRTAAHSTELNFQALADAQRRMLSTFGVAVLDYILQQPNPATPVPRRDLLSRLKEASPGVFDGLSPRQFESLLDDARHGGCAPGLCESGDGLFVIEENIAVKKERNQVGKALIARHAARLVASGMVVAVDGGSTTLPIVQNLLAAVEAGELSDLVILTNSLTSAQVISEFMSSQGWTDESAEVSLHLVGGKVRPNTHATTWGKSVQREQLELLQDLERGEKPIDIGFIGGNGFEAGAGVTMGSPEELGFKRFVLEHSHRAYIVADSSKAGIVLPVCIAEWTEDFTLLTNVLPVEALMTLDEYVLSGNIQEVRE